MISEFQVQLEDLHRVEQAAEDRGSQLKAENRELKRSLARVKQEMMSYETRRQAREERLKRSEAKHRAAREECEKRLAQLEAEHQELLLMTNRRPIADEIPRTHAAQPEGIRCKDPPIIALPSQQPVEKDSRRYMDVKQPSRDHN